MVDFVEFLIECELMIMFGLVVVIEFVDGIYVYVWQEESLLDLVNFELFVVVLDDEGNVILQGGDNVVGIGLGIIGDS